MDCKSVIASLCAAVICSLSSLLSAAPASAGHKIIGAPNIESLSNNCLLMLEQDDEGFLWCGSYDGLNRYDGKRIKVFRFEFDNPGSLSGNIIYELRRAEPGCMWVLTTMGFDKFSTRELRTLEHHPEIRGERHTTAVDTLGNVFTSSFDGQCMYYDRTGHKFEPLPVPEWIGALPSCRVVTTDYNTVWFFPPEQFAYKVQYDFSKGYSPDRAHFSWEKVKLHDAALSEVFRTQRGFFYFDTAGRIYHHDQVSQNVEFMADISEERARYGQVSGIARLGDELFVGFTPSGVLRINLADHSGRDREMIYTNTGVFHLFRDTRQPIVWVATDGLGLRKVVECDSTYSTITSTSIGGLTKPLRTFYTDIDNNLWIGSKGNGLVILSDYHDLAGRARIPESRITRIGRAEGLPDDQVFAIKESLFTPGRVWVATQGPGISYFSGSDRRPVTLRCRDIYNIHDIYEQNDSVLWLASTSTGLVRAVIDRTGEGRVVSTESFTFRNGEYLCSEIYSVACDRGRYLYIGCRGGLGIVRFDLNTHKYNFVEAVTAGMPGIGDIICLNYSGDGRLFFGSSAGAGVLDCRDSDAPELMTVLTRDDGLSNDMVHAVIPDSRGNVWLSTNKGLAVSNPSTRTVYNITGRTGEITEFCDNAGYVSPSDGNIIFGALNGIVVISPDQQLPSRNVGYDAPVKFTSLQINGVENADNLLLDDDGILRLSYKQNVFRLSFAALDYVNGEAINYWYRLEGYNGNWINAGSSAEVTFNNLPPGKYTLKVKCRLDACADSATEYSLPIVIEAPWYATSWAIVLYLLIIIGVAAAAVMRSRKIMQRKRREMQLQLYEKEQEQLHNDRMEFFTNITHELCSPLTMIMGMCDVLHKNIDEDERRKLDPYIDSLRWHSRHLNELVEEILDVRNMEEGSFTNIKVQPVRTDYVFDRWITSYDQIARENDIRFEAVNRVPDLRWNTDISCLGKIVTNLISNAFKYTPKGGEIRVSADLDGQGNLVIDVYNTGSGIAPADLKSIFDKFTVFNNVDRNSYRDMASRHGLGLYICHELVLRLKGEIKVESNVGEFTRFIITLPPLEIEHEHHSTLAERPPLPAVDFRSKPVVLVVDDNPDILWLVSDILSDDYTVVRATSASEALEAVNRQIPALVITDVMMPDVDGIEFVKLIRSHKFAKHLPILILSANITEEHKMEAYNAGADAYLTKPFNPDFLKVVAARLLQRKDNDRDYYRSSESAVTLENGMEISNEGKEFFDRIKEIIVENLNDETRLKPAALAEAVGVDLRTLYRKFKKFTPYTPNEFVKRYRYAYAANLILTTDLSIQEIIYKVGMNNKTVFYADFKKIYGMTPKEYRKSN